MAAPEHVRSTRSGIEDAGRRETPRIHDLVKGPSAPYDQAADEQAEECERHEPVEGSLGDGEAPNPVGHAASLTVAHGCSA